MQSFLNKLIVGNHLTIAEMKQAASYMFMEETTDSEIASFLTALRCKGETTDEIFGLVEAIRRQALGYETKERAFIDNCGTGGDLSGSFNISTTAAFVLAGAGLKVAKHGNRSVSSKTGSADVLEKLGVHLDKSKEETLEMIDENGIAFLYAAHQHPLLKRVMKVRKALKIPTIFNSIGPLTNPFQLETQLVGTYRADLHDTFAEVLLKLGRKRACIITGAGGMDEASLSGDNICTFITDGKYESFTINAADYGLQQVENTALKGGDTTENALILLSVLEGKQSPMLDVVLLNAGIAIFTNGMASTIAEGIERAEESIQSGSALEKLNYLRKKSDEVIV